MTTNITLRFTPDRGRYFLIPDHAALALGDMKLTTKLGDDCLVTEDDVVPFEVTEEQARRWAKDQLAHTLDELKGSIDNKLADVRQQLDARDREPVSPASPITPNAASALLDFFKALPRVVGQGISGDDARIGNARQTMADLQRRLKDAGIDVDDRLQEFPERLAGLRKPRQNGD